MLQVFAPNKPLKIFFSYSHEDERLRRALVKHLSILQYLGVATIWHDGDIGAGNDWQADIDAHMSAADVIVLLVSSSFLGSPACRFEMERALERRQDGRTVVIPVILRPCPWKLTPLAGVLALPTDGRPVTKWKPRDDGFLSAVQGIRDALEGISGHAGQPPVQEDVFNNLGQVPSTPFIGRRKEVAEARRHLRNRHVRAVVLHGPVGVGKSRLAWKVASDLVKDFQNGVCRVGLDRVRDSSLVLPTLARTLGIKEVARRRGTESPLELSLESLREYLRTKEMLLVLDNFEHVEEAGRHVARLLADCPGLKLLMTSRSELHVAGGRSLPVGFLPVPEKDHESSLADLRQVDAVALFLQNAEAVDPGFDLTAENAPAVAEICRRLEGVALAIELAAARVRQFPPHRMLLELDHQLRLGVGGPLGCEQKHETMEAAIAWSYQLLDPGEKTLLQRLSVFSNGFTLEAADAVCNPGGDRSIPVEAGLRSLLRNNLVWQCGPERFRMLAVVREYARKRLGQAHKEGRSEDPLVFERRHAQLFTDFAERAESRITSSRRGDVLERLEAEHANFHAVLDGALKSGELETGLRLAGSLFWFWNLRAYFSEGRTWLGRILARAGDLPETAALAKALYAAGGLAFLQGDFKDALDKLGRSERIWRRLGDRRGLAYTLVVRGMALLHENRLALAGDCATEAESIFHSLGDLWGSALALNDLGNVCRGRGEYEEARETYWKSLALWERMGDSWGLPMTLSNLGFLEMLQERYPEAREAFERALALQSGIGDRWGHGETLKYLGDLAVREKNWPEAVRLYRQSLDLNLRIGRKAFLLGCLGGLAAIASETRRDRCYAARWEVMDPFEAARDALDASAGWLPEAEVRPHRAA
ncbi:MAG TPA: tetratricopeptide repeat protein [Thermoanaerobaculia bacterium]|nr:tetratricopeptide repeat protein [Thermoanaerobaculia bacterium]